MKNRLLFLLLAFGISGSMLAQSVPQGFNYQSIVRDNSTGMPLANQTVTLLFLLRSGAPNGPVAYSEKQVISTNQFGLVNLVIGQGVPVSGEFSTINWGGGAKYLSVSVETSPNQFQDLGSSQLMSVPYALYSQTSGSGSGSGGSDNWGTQTVQTTPVLAGNGTGSSPLSIAQQGAQSGQVLKWDGSKWAPSDDVSSSGTNGGTVTQVNTGTGLTGGPITNSGTIGLANSGVTAGIYGSATQIPVISVDAQGRVTNVAPIVVQPGGVGLNGGTGIGVQTNSFNNFTITNTGDPNAADDVNLTTPFNGDVTGSYDNLQIKPNAVGSPEIADNAVGSSELNDNAVTSSKISPNAVTTAKINNGAVTAAKIDDMDATSGQVLKWNGSSWAPADDESGTIDLTSGSGIAITGTGSNLTITNTGDLDATDDLTTTSTANGDVSGPFSNLQLKPGVVSTTDLANNAVTTAKIANSAVTGAKIDNMGATDGAVLKWNGTTWAPGVDQGGTFNVFPGTGIDVTTAGNNFIVINTGDTDPSDDLTNTSQANGDITGAFTNLVIKNNAVTSSKIAANAVNTNAIANGAITAIKLNDMNASAGQVLRWNGTAWSPATLSSGGSGDDWGAQTAVTGAALTGDGTAASPLNLAKQNATAGQVLKWSGTAWVPGTVTGIGLGDDWGAQIAVTGATLTGDGTVSNPLNLAKQGATNGQVLQWNGNNWVPGTVSGGGVGDNWGSQATVTGTTLDGDGTTVSPLILARQGAATGQVLKWDGTTWTPADDQVGTGGGNNNTYAAGGGISITGVAPNLIINNIGDGDADPSNEIQKLSLTGSALTLSDGGGTVTLPTGSGNNYTSGSGISITGIAPDLVINNTGDADASPTNELQKISLNGNQLTLSNDGGTVTLPTAGGSGNTYSGGTGISITGTAPNLIINNTGDVSNTNEIQAISLAGNNLSLSNGGGTVTLPLAVTYTAGTAISITGTGSNLTINNTGDVSSTNELQTINLAGNNLSLSNGGGTVTLPTGNTYTAGAGISITGTAPNLTIKNSGDLSETNELQNLSLNGAELTISGTNSTVDFTDVISAASAQWGTLGNNIFNKNTGNVLIGTQSGTNGKLQVTNEGSGSAGAFLLPDAGSTSAALIAESKGSGPGGYFASQGGPALLTGAGFVGINVVIPQFLLDVGGAGHFASTLAAPQLTVEQTGSDYGRLVVKNTTGGWTLSGKGGGAAAEFGIDLIGAAAGERAFTIKGNGNVGIGGLNNSTARLKIFHGDSGSGLMLENTASSHNWSFSVSGDGSLVLANDQTPFAGTFDGTGMYTPSDRNLKKEIVDMSTGILNKVLQLQPVTYRYKTQDETTRRSMGFIAQDVQKLFPELVTQTSARNGQDAYLAVNYAGFGVLTIKSIQEQQIQIEALTAENETLKNKVESMDARLRRLEQLLESKKN